MKVNAVLVLLTCLVLMTCIAGLEGKGLKRKSGKSLISSKKVRSRPDPKPQIDLCYGKCHKDATCVKTVSGTGKCQCNKGYSGDGENNCIMSFRPGSKPKIDLCSGRCHKDATCITKWFGGKCQCNKGYSGDGEYNCIMRSRPDPKPQIDLCSGKCHNDATCVKTMFGKGKCQCNKGYSGDGENNCIMRSRPDPKPQIDLCFGKCHKYATCVNTMFGKGPCRCNKGYTGDGVKNCIKQCGKNRQACHKDAECIRGKKTSVCRCKAGMKGDGINSCSDVCECRASGDPHYMTYDGQKIHFQGNCAYTLTDVNKNSTCGIKVVVENMRSKVNKNVAFTRRVYVTLPGNETLTLGRVNDSNEVMRNGIRLYGNRKTASFHLRNDWKYITVKTSCGIVVIWDKKNRVTVLVPRDLMQESEVSGICGNCNGIQDDYRTKDGVRLPKGTKNLYSKIGNSYLVPGLAENNTKRCAVEDESPKCPTNVAEWLRSEDMCGKILSPKGPFSTCIGSGDTSYRTAKSMVEECVYDACEYQGNDEKVIEVVCDVMEAMTFECDMETYVPTVKYSTKNFCPDVNKCVPTMKYNSKMTTLQPSCQNPIILRLVDGPVTRGCECRSGLLFEDDKCVPRNRCGCVTLSGLYYPIGSKMTSPDCRERTICINTKGASQLKTTKLPGCSRTEECVAFNGEYVCRPLPTVKPTTRAPTTRAPATKAPTTKASTTKAPTTKAPATKAPSDNEDSGGRSDGWDELPKKPKNIKECLEPDDLMGRGYWGSQNITTSWRICQLWASNTPHKHGLRELLHGEGRFCRNMGKRVRERPWCFTDDPNVRWEYCDNIPICGQDTKIQVPPKETGCFDVMDKGEHSYNSVTSLMNWGRSGRFCSMWSDKGYSQYVGNFCRNPYGAKSSPWCFIDSDREWEYCSVPQCYKPPPTPKEVASHCIISEETDACLTRIELCGNCYYSYKFNAECAFTAVTTSSARKAQLYLTDNSTVTLTTPGAESKYFGCANVSLDSDCLTITMSTCGWCLKQSVASFMSNDRNKCPAP